jgi:hypothetical protein
MKSVIKKILKKVTTPITEMLPPGNSQGGGKQGKP